MSALQVTHATRDGAFVSTRWTMVLDAADLLAPPDHALSALSELCRIYWKPIFLFLRRQGSTAQDAQDLTQGFFEHLIKSRGYARADREKGRFRSFLLGALKHFLAHIRAHECAQKRGGGLALLSLDAATLEQAEAQMATSPNARAELIFEREWAAALLHHVMQRLEEEWQLSGKGALFAELRSYLAVGTNGAVAYEELAQRLSRPVATLRSDVARLRARYRDILREEVGSTVTANEDVDEELRYLRQVMAG
jgi:DNA-directed RNA polymerase specialized sigma24 family protein